MSNKHEYKVLDCGFIRLVDSMGSDESIANAARVSYGQGTKSVAENRTLLRYMMRHRHTSPFEMAEVVVHVRLPIFVARQWIRHRTASVNELSGRYSELSTDFFEPKNFRVQSGDNKQGSGFGLIDHKIQCYDKVITEYQTMLNKNITREQARIVLPVSTYTEWYWKIDLHNLMHFLGLRLEAHAQEEIRKYAEKIALIVEDLFPITWEAFNDYKLNSVTFSLQESILIAQILSGNKIKKLEGMSKREFNEFKMKMIKLGKKI